MKTKKLLLGIITFVVLIVQSVHAQGPNEGILYYDAINHRVTFRFNSSATACPVNNVSSEVSAAYDGAAYGAPLGKEEIGSLNNTNYYFEISNPVAGSTHSINYFYKTFDCGQSVTYTSPVFNQVITVPPGVSNVQASRAGDNINASWENPGDLKNSGYVVTLEVKDWLGLWKITQTKSGLSNTSTNTTFSNVIKGEEYRVTVNQTYPNGTLSKNVTFSEVKPTSWKITNFNAVVNSNNISLSWDKPTAHSAINNATAAAYYTLKRRFRDIGTTGAWSGWTTILTTTDLLTSDFTDNNVENCKEYDYELYMEMDKFNLVDNRTGYHRLSKNYPSDLPDNFAPNVTGLTSSLSDNCSNDIVVSWDREENPHPCLKFYYQVLREEYLNTVYQGGTGFIVDNTHFNSDGTSNGTNSSLSFANNTFTYTDTDENIKNGYSYNYTVRKVAYLTEGGPITIGNWVGTPIHVQGTMESATGVTASIDLTGGNESFTINWTDNTINEEGFTVKRLNTITNQIETFNVAESQTSFTDLISSNNGPAVCTEYQYTVSAYNGCETDILGTVTQDGGGALLKITKGIHDTYAQGDLDADKGYNKDVVNLDWSVANNGNSLLNQEIWRKPLGSLSDSTKIATIDGFAREYQDFTTNANQLYQYFIVAHADCGGTPDESNVISAVGFRSPYGIITGNVEYTGGIAVEGSKISATGSTYANNSLYFDGDRDYIMLVDTSHTIDYGFVKKPTDLQFLNGNLPMTFEGWIKPEQYTGASIFRVGDNPALRLTTPVAGSNTWKIQSNDITINVNIDVALDSWHHIAFTTDGDSLKFYLDGSNTAADGTPMVWAHNKANNLTFMTIGADGVFSPTSLSFKGNMTELRFWSVARTQEEIKNNMNGYLVGNENGLEIYYRTSEGAGSFVYDASFSGANFNKRHGYFSDLANPDNGTHFSNAVPSQDQLGAVAVTNENGNYVINRVIYNNSGEIFTIVPFVLNHQFQPNSRTGYIGDNTPVLNNQDFEDISAFQVTGTVMYGQDLNGDGVITDGSNGTPDEREVPAEGLFLNIDGNVAIVGGEPIITDENGNFNISVPIGDHFVSVTKPNHEFEIGRFPETGNWDFQQPVSGITFIDKTQLTVIGQVAGGAIEENKEVGFNKGINNIGIAGLLFESSAHPTYTETVFTDSTTGEYSVALYPLKFLIKGTNSLAIDKFLINNAAVTFPVQPIDFTGTPPLQTKVDSVFNADSTLAFVNSLDFNAEKNYYIRNPHTLVVEDLNKNPFTQGESELVILNAAGVNDTILANQFDYPIFKQNHDYQVKISAKEIYVNHDLGVGNEVRDTIGAQGVSIEITNDLATITEKTILLNTPEGDTIYTFVGGDPNLTTISGSDDYTKQFQIASSYGTASDAWAMNAYVLGAVPLGNSFATQGPDVVEHVLRDPPGSNSATTMVQGSSFSSEYEWGVVGSIGLEHSVGVSVGADFTVGIGLETRTDIEGTVSDNYGLSTSTGGGESYTQTIDIEESISTSSDPDYVGAQGDLYIGKSYNLDFGVAQQLKLIPESACIAGATCKTDNGNANSSGNQYSIGLQKGFFMNPNGYETYFVYSEKHIKEELIPSLTDLRNDILINSPYYTVNFTDINDPKYGTNNDDVLWAAAASTTTPFEKELADTTGSSYTFSRTWLPDEVRTDSVRWFNQQIRLWKEAIALNEQQKLNAINGQSLPNAGNGGPIGGDTDRSGVLINQDVDALEQNISFSSGASVSRSTTLSNEMAWNTSLEIDVSYALGLATEAKISNTGIETEFSFSLGLTQSNAWSGSTARSTNFEFTLEDENVGDFYSVDILDGGTQSSPIFKIKGGESSCPYEGADSTDYYLPGTPMQIATIRRDQPGIAISPATQVGIPSDQFATYQLVLSNANPDDERTYSLSANQASNPDGLILLIDGLSPNQSFTIPAGSSIIKTLTVYRGPIEYDYSNIVLEFASPCDEDIKDEVSFNVSFVPTCTPIEFVSPNNQWVLNTLLNDTMPVSFDTYDVNFNGFEKAILKYKPSSSSTWIEDQEFFNLPSAGADTLLLTASGLTNYDWSVLNLLDGNFDLQLETVCTNDVRRTSAIHSGIIDRLTPHLFGQPSPADGVLSPNDEIQITLNEEISSALLSQNLNFDIRGILNGTDIQHFTSLYFDGTDRLNVPSGIDLNDHDFTLEFWVKRDALTAGKVFAQGSADNFDFGFNATNQIVATLAGNSVTSASITDNDWHHIAFIFNNTAQQIEVMLDGVVDVTTSLTNTHVGGSTATIGENFSGNIQDLRVWNDARAPGEIQLNYLKELVGNEQGLRAYWKMTEGKDNIAKDYARARNASIEGAEWSFAQDARSLSFDGVDDHLELQSSSVALTKEADFTLSFWFKGANGVNKTLFSNGKVDDTGAGFDPGAWAIYGNGSGNLVLENNGQEELVSGVNYFDNNWHHIAVTVNRVGNTNIYMDGGLINTFTSNNFAGFGGSKMYIGAYGRIESFVETIDQHFAGNIDEFRWWNTARNEEQIQRDMYNRLTGDEYGLLTYFPFESYIVSGGVPTLTQTIEDQNMSSLPGSVLLQSNFVGGVEATYDPIVPSLKFERPVEPVTFTYAVNTDQVILTITEPLARIENTTLDITVGEIQDLNFNKMESAVTWTAFIDKNQVFWNDDQYTANVNLGQSHTFVRTIVNNSGNTKDFNIDNMPSWLTADITNGQIDAQDQIDVTFTVNSNLNIGTYDEEIALSTTDVMFNEMLELEVIVTAPAPDWTVNPSDFDYSMSIIGTIVVDGVYTTDIGDKVSAYINGDLVGSADIVYHPTTDRYRCYVDVYSNSNNSDVVTFRIWDASQGLILENVQPQLNFASNGLEGSVINPIEFTASDFIVSEYELDQGWNWISVNVDVTDTDVNAVFSDLSAEDAEVIQARDAYDQYNTTTGWIGSLSSNGGIDNRESYKLKLNADKQFEIIGQQVDLATSTIPVSVGWNWIAYWGDKTISLDEALASYGPQDGDLIKGQVGFAVYDATDGWVGSLLNMKPRIGYMLQSQLGGTLQYPQTVQKTLDYTAIDPKYVSTLKLVEFNEKIYASNMNVIANLDVENTTDYILVARNENNDVVGLATPTYSANHDNNVYFLTIYGKSHETISFEAMNIVDGKTYKVIENVNYKGDILVGDLTTSKVLTLEQTTVETNTVIFPNPITDIAQLSTVFETEGQVDINMYNTIGQRNTISLYSGNVLAGNFQLTFDASRITAGVYIVEIVSYGSVEKLKVIIK